MLEKYCVNCDGKEVGNIKVEREGLYYTFLGKLKLTKNKIWRIIASSQEGERDLGICLFDDPYYVLSRRIPAKYMAGDQWNFKAVCPDDQRRQSIPVSDDRPFDQLEHVTDGIYTADEGSGIILEGDH